MAATGGEFPASVTLAGDASNVAPARRFVDTALHGFAVDTDLVALLVSELVANVIRHAATEFTVVVTVGDVARVEVHDGAAASEAFRDLVANPPRGVDPQAAGGRGWMLVSTLASRYGLTDNGPAGKAVWFELPLTAGSQDQPA